MANAIDASASCTVCAHRPLQAVVNFGQQPPANRFLPAGSDGKEQETFTLELGYCPHCETIQLSHRMPMEAMRPRFPWLVYNEPELHLDDVARTLRNLPGIGPSSTALGITYKDQSTLDRLTKLGLPQGRCLSQEDFSIFRAKAMAPGLQTRTAPVDLLLARHIAEHAVDAVSLISELKELVAPGGYLVLELPDSEKILCACNHSFIWEEHISYFTEESLHILAEKVGARVAWFERYPYNYEDSLLAAFQFDSDKPHVAQPVKVSSFDVRGVLQQFHDGFETSKSAWNDLLQGYRNQGQKVAVFGAGHLAVKWINFLGVSHLIDCVIDDNANKAGMFMPGSKLPILPSSVLGDRKIKICISTLSPESELKVRQKLSSYFAEGGIFVPAFKTIGQNA